MIKRLCSKVKCNFYIYHVEKYILNPKEQNNGKCIYANSQDGFSCVVCCYLCKNNCICSMFSEDPFISLTKRNFILRNIKSARNTKRNIGSGSKKKS